MKLEIKLAKLSFVAIGPNPKFDATHAKVNVLNTNYEREAAVDESIKLFSVYIETPIEENTPYFIKISGSVLIIGEGSQIEAAEMASAEIHRQALQAIKACTEHMPNGEF